MFLFISNDESIPLYCRFAISAVKVYVKCSIDDQVRKFGSIWKGKWSSKQNLRNLLYHRFLTSGMVLLVSVIMTIEGDPDIIWQIGPCVQWYGNRTWDQLYAASQSRFEASNLSSHEDGLHLTLWVALHSLCWVNKSVIYANCYNTHHYNLKNKIPSRKFDMTVLTIDNNYIMM